MADKKFSELETASEIKNSDFMALSQDTGNGLVSLKATILAIATKMLTAINFTSALTTADKTVLGAINEVAQGGGGGGAGHTILDDDGTALAQEDDLQFKGVYSTDNSEDGVTEVNVYREMTKAEFDLLSDDEKKGFIRVTDEPDIYSDGHFQPIIYSTEEREIGVWTDGKPLYEKTYELSTALIINAQTWGTTSIDVSFVDKFIGEADIVTSGGQGYVCFTDVDNNNLQLYNPRRDAGIGVKFITIQYTKTADVAGSGTWTPQGVPAVHYSTDEHIVGTYLGETLYEKTIQTTFTATVKINNAFYLGDTPTVGLSNIVDKYMITNFMITNFMTNTIHKIFSVIYDKVSDCFTISNLDNVTTAIPINITLQYTKSS